ncbi:MAG: SurA N-terminal domain-containing protein [Nitrospiraceae bacterium]|nr:MAG: SurA N-terminal domain-containing protein [Nitrospiraceae bacterium]
MRSNKFFSVFLLSAVTFMIIVSFVFWGIGPRDNPALSYVAHVEDEKVSIEEYWRAYDNEFERAKQQYTDEKEIEALNLPDKVINALVDRKVLLIVAERAGITASDKELQDAITGMPYFQKDGVFNPQVYKRALRLNRTTPQIFESGLRQDLIITKISNVIGETAELSTDEYKMLESLEGDNKGQLEQIFLRSKSSQNLQAYIEGMKRQLDITVNRDLVL